MERTASESSLFQSGKFAYEEENSTQPDEFDEAFDQDMGDGLDEMDDESESLLQNGDMDGSVLDGSTINDFSLLSSGSNKRERSNAKAVECLDQDGVLIEVFRSGLAAANKLGISQGDISLCCRGLKPNVNGLRFRFAGEGDTIIKPEGKLKRGYGYILEGENEAKKPVLLTRTTRASRGEYAAPKAENKSLIYKEIAKVKVCLPFL